MLDERPVDVGSGRVRFRVPLHAEMTMTCNGFDDTVRSFGPHFKAVGQAVDSLMMTRRDRMLAGCFH